MKFGNFLAPAALILSLLAAGASAQIRIETVVEGLNYPWDIAVEGNGLMLTEKSGGIVRVSIDGRMIRQAVETSVPIHDDRGRGLLGMAMAPDEWNGLSLSQCQRRRRPFQPGYHCPS